MLLFWAIFFLQKALSAAARKTFDQIKEKYGTDSGTTITSGKDNKTPSQARK